MYVVVVACTLLLVVSAPGRLMRPGARGSCQPEAIPGADWRWDELRGASPPAPLKRQRAVGAQPCLEMIVRIRATRVASKPYAQAGSEGAEHHIERRSKSP